MKRSILYQYIRDPMYTVWLQSKWDIVANATALTLEWNSGGHASYVTVYEIYTACKGYSDQMRVISNNLFGLQVLE